MLQPSLAELEQMCSPNLIFRAIAGSKAYGTQHGKSDTDIRGVYVLSSGRYLSLSAPPAQIADERGDTVYYTLKRFLELASGANPNIIELLYLPGDCVLYTSPLMTRITENRDMFITRQAYESHVGYARAQIKKARGRKKWINQPQPREAPVTEQFCWFLSRTEHRDRFPFRPVPFLESGINQNGCRCAAVEHVPGLYRLYDYGGELTVGVIRGGKIVCESIPMKDEKSRLIGLLYYHKEAHEQARRNHRGYWEWVQKRNQNRWTAQERGEIDYDAKNMMHTFRLILSGEHILRNGAPLVRFSGERLTFLKEILAGSLSYESLVEKAEEKIAGMDDLVKTCGLPDRPNAIEVDELLKEITEIWEKEYARSNPCDT
ncbi:MAG: nucleotidyltransferase domain-containing protein [Acidobacteriota bacterium]|nr:nucleotidyltransferase domain-containing protein [Acidobacteriota bacterium]